jgi:hypothetical protein
MTNPRNADVQRGPYQHRKRQAENVEPAAASLRILRGEIMFTFLLWCVLLVICWPLALLALFLYPIVWLLLLPFRIVGIAVNGILEVVKAIIFLPARVLRGRA